MQEIKELFESIGKGDADLDSNSLLSEHIIDSLDIMAIVSALETKYGKNLDFSFIQKDNFESAKALKNMIQEAFKVDL